MRMRLVLENNYEKTLFEDRSPDGIKRYAIINKEDQCTQIFNSLWYSLEYVTEYFYE